MMVFRLSLNFFLFIFVLSLSQINGTTTKAEAKGNRVGQTEVQNHNVPPKLTSTDNFDDGDRLDIDKFKSWILRSETTPVPKEKLVERKSTEGQEFFFNLVKLEKGCSSRRQIFAVISQGTSEELVQLWVIDSRACFDSPRRMEWRTLKKKLEQPVKIGPAAFGELEFYINRKESPEPKIANIKLALKSALQTITSLVKFLLAEDGESIFLSDVPVLFRSTPARDVPTVTRETIMYAIRRAINDYQDATKVNLFTTPQLAVARSGMVEALEAFYSVNFYNIPELVRTIENWRGSTDAAPLYKKLDGILEIGQATIQIAFPVQREVIDGAIRTVDVHMKHPTIPPHKVSVFATSFVNYGITRALAMLVKGYCNEATLVDGICAFPCFSRGWRQKCQVGDYRLPLDLSTGMGEPINNALERPAGFCSRSLNPSIKLARLKETCAEVLLNSTIEDDDERMSVKGCKEIRGTGDAETCGKAIYNSIMKQQFPANQDAIYVGASVPDEVGASNLFSVTTPLRITGVVVNRAVYIARKIGWLPKKSKAVLSDIQAILPSLCLMEAHISNGTLTAPSVPTNTAQKSIPLTVDSIHLCFRLTYIVKLLEAFGVKASPDGDLVDFDDFKKRHAVETADRLKRKYQSSPFAHQCPIPTLVDIGSTEPLYPATQDDSQDSRPDEPQDSEMDYNLNEATERPFETPIGMILRQIFSDDLLKNVFILGAAHWKNNAFMSPIDDAVQNWLRDNAGGGGTGTTSKPSAAA